jgi:serine/threonine-protein kinase RsbW
MLMCHADSLDAPLLDRSERQGRWRAKCITSIQELTPVVDALAAVMTELGYPPKDIFGARLALEEALCNSIKHGHNHDPNKVVEVRYLIRPDRLQVEVEDEGPGFDPTQVPDATAPENLERACGRGLLLIRHYAAWVCHNRAGNCVSYCILRSVP